VCLLGQDLVDADKRRAPPFINNEPWPSGFECRGQGAEVIPAGFEVAVLIELAQAGESSTVR